MCDGWCSTLTGLETAHFLKISVSILQYILHIRTYIGVYRTFTKPFTLIHNMT